MGEAMAFNLAASLDLRAADDSTLVAAWHSYASRISYHHADDSGKEWAVARELMPRAREIETLIRDRGLERPTGDYLMAADDRIDWETGQWSPGWAWRKRKAECDAMLAARGEG